MMVWSILQKLIELGGDTMLDTSKWQAEQDTREQKALALLRQHPTADLSIWILDKQGNTHEAVIGDVFFGGDYVSITVS